MSIPIAKPPDQRTKFDAGNQWHDWLYKLWDYVRTFALGGTITGGLNEGGGVAILDTGATTSTTLVFKTLTGSDGVGVTNAGTTVNINGTSLSTSISSAVSSITSLSTSSSTGIASLSTGVLSLSTGLSTASSNVSSLSTSTSSGLSTANSRITSLSTSTSSGLSTVTSSVVSLSSSTSSGLSTATSGITSLSTSASSGIASLSSSTSSGLSTVTSSVVSLSTSASAGLSTHTSQIASLSTATNLKDQIWGLKMVWVSNTSISVSSGEAYISSLGRLSVSTSTLTLSGLSLSASTFYHVYLFEASGVPSIECVTTAPAAPYQGTARTKTGDTSRRYLGSILTNPSSQVLNFLHTLPGNILYQSDISAAQFTLVSAGTATVYTTVGTTGIVPSTARTIGLVSLNSTPAAYLVLSNSTGPTSPTGYLMFASPGGVTSSEIGIDSSGNFTYALQSAAVSGGVYLRVYGYLYER